MRACWVDIVPGVAMSFPAKMGGRGTHPDPRAAGCPPPHTACSYISDQFAQSVLRPLQPLVGYALAAMRRLGGPLHRLLVRFPPPGKTSSPSINSPSFAATTTAKRIRAPARGDGPHHPPTIYIWRPTASISVEPRMWIVASLYAASRPISRSSDSRAAAFRPITTLSSGAS